MDVLITPDGGGKMWGIPYCRYFLEEDSKAKRELPFLRFDKYNEHLDYLPVEQTSRYELVITLKMAKAMHLAAIAQPPGRRGDIHHLLSYPHCLLDPIL